MYPDDVKIIQSLVQIAHLVMYHDSHHNGCDKEIIHEEER